jgi:hypothetical protein
MVVVVVVVVVVGTAVVVVVSVEVVVSRVEVAGSAPFELQTGDDRHGDQQDREAARCHPLGTSHGS